MYKFYHLTHYTHAICFVVGYSRNDYSYCLFKLVDDLICFDPQIKKNINEETRMEFFGIYCY